MYVFYRAKDTVVTGPFPTEEDFGEAIALHSKTMWNESNSGDFYGENVLVRKIVGPITNKDEYELAALVDWGTAVGYPSYWEYAHIFPLSQWIDDWMAYIEKFLDPLPLEGAMTQVVFSGL